MAGAGLGIRPYILAGGRSSRMGRDKAMLMLGGKTLLARAVESLRHSELLQPHDGHVVVTLCGERTELEGADRSLVDRYPGCGPLGGMEAALRDLDSTGAADWAFFMPVDMPFLLATVIDGLLHEWIEASRRGALVCHAVVDGMPQPLAGLVHRSLHSHLVEALAAGRYKVAPVLQSACAVLSSDKQETGPGTALWISYFSEKSASLSEQDSLSFMNVNTQEDMNRAKTLVRAQGSTK